MVGQEFRSPVDLFDAGGYYRRYFEYRRSIPTTLFLASASATRYAVIQRVVKDIGLGFSIKVVDGPTQEEGLTPVARAENKVWHVAKIIVADGFRNRHPGDLILIVAADSRNFYKGVYRDKPTTVDDQIIFHDEWLRIKVDRQPVWDESGYAVLAIRGNLATLRTETDSVRLQPASRLVIDNAFRPPEYSFAYNCVNAHGLPTKKLIENGGLFALTHDGHLLSGREAVERTHGASEQIFRKLILSALISFAK